MKSLIEATVCKGYLLFIPIFIYSDKKSENRGRKKKKGKLWRRRKKRNGRNEKKRDDDSRSERLTVYSSVCFSVRLHDLYCKRKASSAPPPISFRRSETCSKNSRRDRFDGEEVEMGGLSFSAFVNSNRSSFSSLRLSTNQVATCKQECDSDSDT